MNWVLLRNSLLVAGGTTVAAVGAGSLAAVWLSGLRSGGRRALLAAAVISLALPPFLVTNCWLDLVGLAGVWRGWLPVNIYSLSGTVWILTFLFWPIALILVSGGLQKLEGSQLESEPALRGWSLIRWLLFPAARPALSQAATLTFVLALNNFAVPAILQTKVFPAELWVSFNTTFDYVNALKLSWPMLVLPVLLLAWLSRSPVTWPRVEAGVSPGLFRQRLGLSWFSMAGLATIFVVLFSVVVPLGQLFMGSRTWVELPNAFAAGQRALLNSFVFAALASSLCGLLGLALWRWRWSAGLWLPFLLPGVLLGIALIYLFNRAPLAALYQSAGMVVFALAARYAALARSGAGRAMQSVDRALVDFAKLNGATRWQLFSHVHWPQIAPEIAAVWLVTYLLCLWDVETLVLIIPPGCETLALRIFNLLHYGHNAQVNALCVLLLGLAMLPVLFWTAFQCRVRSAECGVKGGQRGMGRAEGGVGKIGLIMVGGMILVGSGCQPGSPNQARIESKLFSKVEIIGSRGTALGYFNKPRSVAVDARDNLYVVDMTGRVQKFSSNGVYLLSWQMPQTEKGKPKGMCRDSAGNIVVVEPHYTRLNHFSPEGKLAAQWGTPGTNAGQLCLPRAVAVNAQGDLFVCEYTLVDRVQGFTAEGKRWRMAFGRSGRGEGEFNRPEGLAVDRQNRIYVADSCNHRIQVFSPEGKFLRSYGHAGSGLGELSYPYDVQVDANGLQYVAEFGNSRVQVFDQQGQALEILGGTGAAPGQFSNPWGLALDSAGNLFVADSQNHRVQKFIRKAAVAP